ncbi:hypothetical protein PORY_001303 [Pneumocystis oryctolagi]|uniref:Uncharacterized protein n=1 Tax=Pneumocystis oryctolagi TaxID=42067 RepID=A0ACB7CDV0_9ASCO|nr:hypothetical protein PORY_001303 [Pneumocystis oryctolagi]
MTLKNEDEMPDDTLSHEQIWDDSELIAAWEATVNEYKTYHSQANKDNLETQEILTASSPSSMKKYTNTESLKENISESHSDETFQETESKNDSKKIVDEFAEPPSIAPPLHIFDHDQTLRNLLMSWYYAGYYTGYYMGQDSVRNEKS